MRSMTIGSLAALSGTPVTTIRFYERARLMSSPDRTAGGHRSYGNDDLRRLRFIRRARAMEFSIDEIRRLLVLADPERMSCGEVQQMAAAHLRDLRQKIAKLTELESALAMAVERCSGNPIPQCAVLELLVASDRHASTEAGPSVTPARSSVR